MAALPAGTGAADQIENRVQGLGEAGPSRRSDVLFCKRSFAESARKAFAGRMHGSGWPGTELLDGISVF